MTSLSALVLLALQAQPQTTADSLIAMAAREPVTSLEGRARIGSLDFREAVRVALARSVEASRADDRRASLDAARHLAEAHARAWDDAFLVRQVERFAGASPQWRRVKLEADSLRRAGSASLARDGLVAALPLWQASVERATGIDDLGTVAAATGNIGVGYYHLGVLDSAEVYLERARGLAMAAGDRVVEGNSVGALAVVDLDRGDLASARRLLDEAIAIRRLIGDTRGAAADHNNLGDLAWEVGDLAEAARHFEVALDLNRREGRDEVAATNLTNLAGLAAVAGDFPRALSMYGEALTTYTAAERWWDAADVLRGLGQLEMRRGDYPAARHSLGEALTLYDRVGSPADAIAVRREITATHAAMGHMQTAVDELREIERVATEAGASADVLAGLALAGADLAVAMNRLADAEQQYALAEGLYAEAGDGAGQAEAWQGQGLLLLEREEFARAEDLLTGAARAQDAAGNTRGAALTRTLLAEARLRLGDPGAARSMLQSAKDELASLGDAVAVASTLAALGDLQREAGLPRAADSLYAAALTTLGDLPAPDVRWRLHFGRGLAARSRGALDAAAVELEAAVGEIDTVVAGIVLPERRSAYRADKLDAYAELALTERMRGRADRAFDVSERLRAREALDLLRMGRLGRPTGIAGDLLEREHDLRVRIAELTREVEPVEPGPLPYRGPDPTAPGAPAREALARARRLYADLQVEMRERAPRQADLLTPATVSWREVAERLGPGEALLEYLLTDSSSVAFVVTRDTVAVLDLGITRQDVARLVEFIRAVLERPVSSSDQQWRSPLRRLHQHLIGPAEEAGLLTGKATLVLVPHGELHYLPFAALLDGDGTFVVERYTLAIAPSASVWAALGERPPSRARGTLALAPRPEALPASRREVAAVAAARGGDAAALTGSAASEATFRRTAGDYRELHLATYGVLNKHNPLFSFVDLAPGGGYDGRLEVHEVFELELDADLVVLSACQTALGSGAVADVPAGDDWIGLTRAFLQAGAARVVATLWAVEDRATADLMERFYAARFAAVDDASALAEAQRTLLRDRATAHPFHWAGVVLVGAAGGGGGR